MSIWITALRAMDIQPLVFLARVVPDYLASSQPLYGIGFMLLAVAVSAAAIELILGIPAFLMLRKLHRASWVSLAVAGLGLGAFPAAFPWPGHLEGFSAGQNWHGTSVETFVNGMPTTYAWLTYGEGVLFFALHGVIGALVFYAIWRRLERPTKSLQSHAGDG